MRRAVFVSRRLFQALGPTVAELGAVNEALCDDDKLEQNTLLGRDTMVSLGTVQKRKHFSQQVLATASQSLVSLVVNLTEL